MSLIVFARNFGGGVLTNGAVQEEILLLEFTESIVGLLLFGELGDDEALMITGLRRYNSIAGYAQSMRWVNIDRKAHRKTRTLLAMDAICFGRDKSVQFKKDAMERELLKAYTAFSLAKESTIGTGSWGCGIFNVSRKVQNIF
jgi:hypothetical protein